MRWTDLPTASPVRPLAAWRRDWRERTGGDDAALDARLAARGEDDAPIVLLAGEAARAARRHVAASRVERGGLLAGVPVARAATDGGIALVHVTAAIAGLDDEATPLSLRLDATVWARANAQLHAGEVVVGWFHSHPGLGAFFSDTDRRTQAAFFAQAYSLGWVIDPLRGEEAWFAGPRAQPVGAGAVLVAGAR